MTATAPERFVFEKIDGTIAGWRWARPGAPRLLFCHATGFCASAYRQTLAIVAEAHDVTALDMRGHGRTGLPADPRKLKSWGIYARDVGEFLDAHRGGGSWVLAGHSMGGVVAALTAVGRADIAELRLVEPVVMPSYFRWFALTPLWRQFAMKRPPASLAARRRAEWPDRASMEKVYARKGLFARFVPGAIADYLEDGVIETDNAAADGKVRLACDRAWEAATFIAQANDFSGAIRRAPCPVNILAAGGSGSTVPRATDAWLTRRCSGFFRADGAGHLLPMEDPGLAAKFLKTSMV